MPWTGAQFRARHNRGLSPAQARKGARVANAMLARGLPEGEAIATGNARAEQKAPRLARAPGFRGRKTRSYRGA